MGVRPLLDCDEEQLANAGIVVVYDDGDLRYCYAATGRWIEDPARQMVPVPASTALRGGAGGEQPPDQDISGSPSRRQRRILVGATAAVAVTGSALFLPVNLLPDRATPVTGSPSVARSSMPLSISQWEQRAGARLAEIAAQLQLVEAALRAWEVIPAHRREGLILEPVIRLWEKSCELRRKLSVLSVDCVA